MNKMTLVCSDVWKKRGRMVGNRQQWAVYLRLQYEVQTPQGPMPWSVSIPWTAMDSGLRWRRAAERAAVEYRQICRQEWSSWHGETLRADYIEQWMEWNRKV